MLYSTFFYSSGVETPHSRWVLGEYLPPPRTPNTVTPSKPRPLFRDRNYLELDGGPFSSRRNVD